MPLPKWRPLPAAAHCVAPGHAAFSGCQQHCQKSRQQIFPTGKPEGRSGVYSKIQLEVTPGGGGGGRFLYSARGLLTGGEDQAMVRQRQSPKRLATLVPMAVYHRLDARSACRCWIAQHPAQHGTKSSNPPHPIIVCHMLQTMMSIAFWTQSSAARSLLEIFSILPLVKIGKEQGC